MKAFLLILALAWVAMPAPAHAVQPDEILSDPVLEKRARAISKNLRCLVCRNESIDDSNAPLARDLRLLVRERLTAGDSDAATVQYVVDRYGEYVLLKPKFSASNAVLWLAGPALFVIGLLAAWGFLRTRQRATPSGSADLSAEEQARLNELLDGKD